MNGARIRELAEQECIVGKYYKILCVHLESFYGKKNVWIPIIGPKHSDKEFLNFPAPHWHVDWRFMKEFSHEPLGGYGTVANEFSYFNHAYPRAIR